MSGKFGQKAAPAATTAATQNSDQEFKNIEVLDVRVALKQDGTVMKDNNGQDQYKLQLGKDIGLTYKGVPIDVGQYNNLFIKTAKQVHDSLTYLVENSKMKPETADSKLDFIEGKQIKFQLSTKNPKV